MGAKVTELVNAVGVQRRSVEQVRFKWGNLQQGAKKSFTDARKHARQTGGGPPEDHRSYEGPTKSYICIPLI